MASHIWIGGAPAVAQIDSITFPSDAAAGQIVNMVIGLKTLPVTLTWLTLSDIVNEVVSAWNSSTIPEFAEVTASIGVDSNGVEDGTMKLTADTAGKPFAVTVSIGTGNNEIQVITLSGTAATGGTFTLTFDGQTTGNIAYNASSATLETALEALSNIGVGDATVSGSAGGPWTVEFTNALAGTNVALMTIDTTNLTGGTNEVQTISSPNSPTNGSFKLTFQGQETVSIAYNANHAGILSALEGLSNIPVGSVSCTGGYLPGTPVVVTFQDELAATDVELMTVDASGLLGITGSAAETQAGGSTVKDKAQHYFKYGATSTADYTCSVGSGQISPTASGGWSRVTGGKLGYGLYSSGSGGINASVSGWGQFDGSTDHSFSCWVKFDAVSASKLIMGHSNASSWEWAMRLNADNTFSFLRKNGTTDWEASSTGTATVNTWHHVVGVWDWANKRIKISVDGAAFDETTITDTIASSALSTSYLRFGTVTGLLGSSTMAGFLDSVGIYSEALTIGEAQSVYNSGAGDDYPFPGAGVNEIQTLSITGSPTSGSVRVSYQGEGVDIPYDASAAEAEALLDTVSTIGAGNVSVSGGDWPGTALVVEFINDLALTDIEMLDVDTSSIAMEVTETTKGVSNPVGDVATTVSPLTSATSTASEGPNHWDTSENWNTNTVPVTSDTVYISDTDTSILYGLDQSAVTLAALHIEQTFSGTIGLPRLNVDGTSSYFEYRDTYLKIGATTLFIGDKAGDGSERVKIDLGTVQTTALITDSGDGPDGNTPAILLLGTHASNVININRGSLGVAYYPTEVATVATLRQAFFDDAADDTNVYLGAGVTVTDIVKTGGVLDINSATTTFRQTAGTTTVHDGAHAVLNILAGLLNYNSTGTLTAANLSGDAILVFDQDARPKDVTIINKFTDDSEIYDVSGSIASPVIDLENCGDLSTLHMGQDFKLTFGATT